MELSKIFDEAIEKTKSGQRCLYRETIESNTLIGLMLYGFKIEWRWWDVKISW